MTPHFLIFFFKCLPYLQNQNTTPPLPLGPQIPLLLKQAKQNPFISGTTVPSRAQRVCVCVCVCEGERETKRIIKIKEVRQE